MKKIIFNDSRQIQVQSVSENNGVLHVRLILTTAESLKALFGDSFAASKMTLVEEGKITKTYENYTEFKYVKEESGGIFEVEMVQAEADTDTRIKNLEEQMAASVTDIQQGFAEITLLINAVLGGTEDV